MEVDPQPKKEQKPKAFDKKTYWNEKRGMKNKAKKKHGKK